MASPPAAPPTVEQLFALLSSFQDEYRTAIKEGKILNDLITSKPSEERFGNSHPPSPSAELYAINKVFWMGRKASFSADNLKDLPSFRIRLASAFEAFCGRAVVERKNADALLEKRSVQGYWISWPGVDVSDGAPTVLYLHGGGMVMGEPLYLFGFLDRLSLISGCRVLAIKYRLCPENSAVDAVADAVVAYRHLLDDLKVPSKKIFLVGESGGGQMVLLTAQSIAKQGLSSPAAAWAISPVCTADDDDNRVYRVPTFQRDADHMFCDPDLQLIIGQMVCNYGKPGALDGKDGRTSPMYGSFQNVCPLYFTASDSEVYVNEGIETEKIARAAGVITHIVVLPHAPHGGPVLNTPEGIANIATAFTWMKKFSQ
jgi:acetyl esterase/lipase